MSYFLPSSTTLPLKAGVSGFSSDPVLVDLPVDPALVLLHPLDTTNKQLAITTTKHQHCHIFHLVK
jgi:hypothetical protein